MQRIGRFRDDERPDPVNINPVELQKARGTHRCCRSRRRLTGTVDGVQNRGCSECRARRVPTAGELQRHEPLGLLNVDDAPQLHHPAYPGFRLIPRGGDPRTNLAQAQTHARPRRPSIGAISNTSDGSAPVVHLSDLNPIRERANFSATGSS